MARNPIIAEHETDMFGLTSKEIQRNKVVKANDIIRNSRFSLTAQQQKILLYIISAIDKDDTELNECILNIVDYCEVAGIGKEGNIYNQIKEQIKDIADKSIWIKTEEGRETLVRWIEKPYIEENSGLIRIRLDKDMKPYLIQLKNNFTQYKLIYPMSFNSKYSIRLYELLKSYIHSEEETYTKIFDIDELKKILDCENYTTFKDFNNRVLLTARREINTKSDLEIEYEYIKKSNGRKVQFVKIYIFDTERMKGNLRVLEHEFRKNYDF